MKREPTFNRFFALRTHKTKRNWTNAHQQNVQKNELYFADFETKYS